MPNKVKATDVVYVVECDSPHFTFHAFGRTRDEAAATFMRLIKAHARQTGASPDWVASVLSDYTVVEVEMGAGYRDGDKVL